MTVRIRGVIYPTQKAAAEALGLTPAAICNALREGREDRVGLPSQRQGGRNPCWIGGKRYASQTEAARALGVSSACISLRLKRQRQKAAGMGL